MVITEDDELLFSVLFERDFLPQDAEALLGFKPKNGRHVCVSDTCVPCNHMNTQSIDAIERTFGTLILNTFAGAVIDGDERIINTNVILDIDEENQSISTSLTNEFFNGEIYLTKTSMAHLLNNIDWV